MRLPCLAAFVALPLASPLLAQDGPSFDCAAASTGAEELICADEELAALDRALADRFAAALAVAGGLDAGAEEAVETLRTTQRGWIGGRDECWKSDDPRACVEDAMLRRDGELAAQWMLEEPTATVFWTCGGDPANEVVTMFFDTPLPSVRIERGDAVRTATLSPTASGARYDGAFGEYIWTVGEEATYRSPDPDGQEITCVPAG